MQIISFRHTELLISYPKRANQRMGDRAHGYRGMNLPGIPRFQWSKTCQHIP